MCPRTIRLRRWILAVVVCLVPAGLDAQTVINPRFADFTASPDHAATKLDGTSVVTRYELVATAVNATGALVWTQDLGKPTPNAGTITVALPAALTITPETLYTATVRAIGPDGSSPPSAPSNPFGVAGTRVPAAASNVRLRVS